ncbi:MAG: hypothetical protein ABSF76_17195 [Opitutaceae bacterium]|jgi:hypothetical protein
MRFIKSIAVLFGASAAVAAPLDHTMQKKQLESLIGAALPFAQTMLTNHGEFFPFGATMSPDEKISSVGADPGGEHPPSAEVIALLKGAYRKDGASGKIIACALVYDVRTVPPGSTEKSDAVAIDLNHRDGMSVTMYYPYHIDPDKKVVFGTAFAVKGPDDIFPRK